jgi:hypothetical protein
MIGAQLQAELDLYAQELWRSSPLHAGALAGALDGETVTRYLNNILYLIRFTPIYLTQAHEEAKRRGWADLAAFYLEKRGEEQGHDQWALEDLAGLGKKAGEGAEHVTASFKTLVKELGELISDDPTLYLGYIFFSEYLTVVLGPRWLAALRERCGIHSELTVVGNHVELDKDHVLDDLKAMSSLVPEEKHAPMMAALARYKALYSAFSREVTH